MSEKRGLSKFVKTGALIKKTCRSKVVACFQTQHSALTEPSAGARQALVIRCHTCCSFLRNCCSFTSCDFLRPPRIHRNKFCRLLCLLSLRKYCCLSRFFLAALGLAALLHVLLFTSACLATPPSSLPSIGRLCWLVAFARSSSSLYWLA